MSLSEEMTRSIKEAMRVRAHPETTREEYIRNLAIADTLASLLGQVVVLEDELYDTEAALKKLEDANYWREKNSGYGRGDSMG